MPAPAPPFGRALASDLRELTVDRGPGLRRGGGTHVFPDPARTRRYVASMPPPWQRPSPLPLPAGRVQDRPWPQRPLRAPAPPMGRALASELQERTVDRGPGLRRRGGTHVFPRLPRSKFSRCLKADTLTVAEADACATPRRMVQDRPRPQRPRPARAPPMTGPPHPPGRALASDLRERTVDRGPGLRRGGGTHVFPDPTEPGATALQYTLSHGRG
jgi:hypothetical protein